MRRLSTILAATCFVLFTTLTTGPVASGQTTTNTPDSAAEYCGPYQFCLYADGYAALGYQILSGRSGTASADLSQYECAESVGCRFGTFNDSMSAWSNNTGMRYCWYVHGNFVEPLFVMESFGAGTLVTLLPHENDSASSVGPC